MNIKNVVIIGAGFGGLACAFRLETLLKKHGLNNVSLTLIDKNRYHTYIPALYEVASASSKVSEDTLYHRTNLLIKHLVEGKNITFVKAQVKDIHVKEQFISFEDGSGLEYDYLILACGAKTNFYKIPGLAKHAIDLKDFISALRIRRSIKMADEVPDTIIIGGGGATGVELAGELHSCLKNEHPAMTIIEGASCILPSFPDYVGALAAKRLKKLKIQTLLGNTIKKVTKRTILLSNGRKIPYSAFFWTGGIIPQPLIDHLPFQKERGFLKVASCFQVMTKKDEIIENIFALGDACVTLNLQGNVIPWTAQKAISEGKQVAYNVVKQLLGQEGGICKPQKIQFVIPISGKWAIAYIHGILYSGFWGWALKNLVELNYLFSILPWYKALPRAMQTTFTFTRND